MKENKNPRFSIIVTAYNLEKLISTAIDSILKQTYKDFELLVIDDCSSDKTVDVIKKYEEKDSRVKLLVNEKNSGPSIARNNAMEVAKGEYIVYLDGDDTLYNKETLKNIDKTIGEDGADIIYFGVQYVGGSNKAYVPNAQNSTQEARIVCDMHFPVASKVWRREFLIENDIKFIGGMYYEDMVYSIKAAILSKKLKYGEFPIYIYYRNREGSIMSTPNLKRCTDMYLVMYHLMELYKVTPERLQPYLMSFIKNETHSIPMRLDAVVKSMKDKTFSPVIPKRNYVFTEEEPDVIDNTRPKLIAINGYEGETNTQNTPNSIEIKEVNPSIAASGLEKKFNFDNK